jgi:AcrR family transcriptional regulator
MPIPTSARALGLRTARSARPTRALRAPLTRQRIVQAALDQTAQDGLAALSTRRLGQRLGCEAMSIYHHFPSKAHLLDAMVDHALQSIEPPPADLAPVQRLRRSAYAYRAMAHRFAALFALVAVHRLNTPTGVRFIEAMLALVHAVVPDTELAARHFRTLGYYLAGAALDESSGYAKGPSAAEPVGDNYLREHCPMLVGAAPYFRRGHWDATFELGLEAMLAAMLRDASRLKRSAKPR